MVNTVSMQQLCTGGGQIETLVLVDRTVDPLTPLCTQLTYEGLVDETLHIKNGVVQLGAEGLPASPYLYSGGSSSASYHSSKVITTHMMIMVSTVTMHHSMIPGCGESGGPMTLGIRHQL